MTQEEEILLVKISALDKIWKLYQPRDNGGKCTSYDWMQSWPEERDDNVRGIINELEKKLKKIKQKHGHRIVQKS